MSPIILPFNGIMPRIHPSAFVAPGAVVVGDVEIGPDSSIWFGCVLRGDVHVIRIGARTNIQDGTIIHVAAGGQGTHIGDNVTVGHMALLHDCTVESGGFIGMKSGVLDGAKIRAGGMLAAGALLTAGKTVPAGQIWSGTPAKYWRDIKPEERQEFDWRADQYVELKNRYLSKK